MPHFRRMPPAREPALPLASVVTDQPVPGGEQARRGAVGRPDLGVDVLDMVSGGLARNHQMFCYFGVFEADGQQPQHFHLACCQLGGQLRAARHTLTRHAQDRVDRIAVKPAGPHLTAKLDRRLAGGARGPMRSRLYPRSVGVGRSQDSARQRDRVRADAPRVAGTVEPFVVFDRQRTQGGQGLRKRKNALAQIRVQPDPFQFGGGQRTGLVPDRIRDTRGRTTRDFFSTARRLATLKATLSSLAI